MKQLILIVLFLFSVSLFSHNQNVYKRITCEDGTEQAIQDAKNGIYKSITYGFLFSTDWNFDRFYWKYVKDEYNVILGSGGCIVTDEILCYTLKMKELIYQKFGNDFFEKTKEEAKRLYEKSKQD